VRDIENGEGKREADADEGEGEDKSETGNEITYGGLMLQTRILAKWCGGVASSSL